MELNYIHDNSNNNNNNSNIAHTMKRIRFVLWCCCCCFQLTNISFYGMVIFNIFAIFNNVSHSIGSYREVWSDVVFTLYINCEIPTFNNINCSFKPNGLYSLRLGFVIVYSLLCVAYICLKSENFIRSKYVSALECSRFSAILWLKCPLIDICTSFYTFGESFCCCCCSII